MKFLRAFAGGGGFYFEDSISSNLSTGYLLTAKAIAAGWDQVKPLIASVKVSNSSLVTSEYGGVICFNATGSFPIGSRLVLSVESGSRLYGKGSDGGSGGTGSSGGNGGNGGSGLSVNLPTTVNNLGTIAGGGGGGAGGASPTIGGFVSGGGGGGGGAPYGAGGAGGNIINAGTSGASATDTSGGARGVSQVGGYGYGGAGGNLGQAGSDASSSNNGNFPGAAGAAGVAIAGNSFITWVATGTLIGAIT